jgi:hypothetical protein
MSSTLTCLSIYRRDCEVFTNIALMYYLNFFESHITPTTSSYEKLFLQEYHMFDNNYLIFRLIVEIVPFSFLDK